jgi:hypothetical protein
MESALVMTWNSCGSVKSLSILDPLPVANKNAAAYQFPRSWFNAPDRGGDSPTKIDGGPYAMIGRLPGGGPSGLPPEVEHCQE